MGERRWTEGEAREVIADLQSSGLPVAEFARLRGLNPQRLSRWAERLRADSPDASTTPVSFLPASVVGAGAPVSLRVGDLRVDINPELVSPRWLVELVVEFSRVRR